MENKLGVALVKEACPACGKLQDGPIIMNTLLTEKLAKKVEAMHGETIGHPWRSGHMWVLKQEDAERVFGKENLKHGIVMLDIKAAKQIGLEVETI